MTDLTAVDWSVLVVAALLVGFAKTAIGGVGAIAVAIFAAVLPARESTGALLPLLIVGDVVAVSLYRRHADWATLIRLFPSVAVGILVGVAFVAQVGDTGMRRTIGAILLALTGLHLWQRRRGAHGEPTVPREVRDDGRWLARGFGLLSGFTTMVANAAGPVMALYLLSAGMSMLTFLGTGAWFFLLVNVFKVPFSAGLGLITVESLTLNALLVPALLGGAVVGRVVIRRLDQSRFERLVLVFTVLASLNLVR